MTKSNPLFVDSTKFKGDLINCQIELRDILLYDGESLLAVVTDHLGVTRRLAMKPSDEKGYEAKVHLHHQTLITYRFVIEKDGTYFLCSAARKARAQYAVIEQWEPAHEDAATFPLEALQELSARAPSVPVPQPKPGADWARESSMGIRALIDKWGL